MMSRHQSPLKFAPRFPPLQLLSIVVEKSTNCPHLVMEELTITCELVSDVLYGGEILPICGSSYHYASLLVLHHVTPIYSLQHHFQLFTFTD